MMKQKFHIDILEKDENITDHCFFCYEFLGPPKQVLAVAKYYLDSKAN